MNKWKLFSGFLMAMGGIVFYGRLLLLEQFARLSVHHAPYQAWSIREQYGSVIFYVTRDQERWLCYLEVAFWIIGAALAILALIRGKEIFDNDVRGVR